MSKRIVGFVTLGVSILVLILSIACCIYAAVALRPARFKVQQTLSEFQGCLAAVDYHCNPGASFSCSNDLKNGTTVCGLSPGCLCIGNSTIGVGFLGASQDMTKFFDGVVTIVADLNLTAGILCIIGILPVLAGAIGAILDIDVLEKTCGILGIIFEACFGVFSTMILSGISYFVALSFDLLKLLTQSLDTSNHGRPPHGHHNHTVYDVGDYNTCPRACSTPLNDISNTLGEVSQGCSTSSNLAMAAVAFSVIALICTCVGFCMRRQQQQDTALSATYEHNKTPYGALR